MTKALVTFGVGSHAPLLEIALPSFRHFCDLHGYLLEVPSCDAEGRPPAWGKIRAVERMLAAHDEVLWLDADCVICDFEHDPAALVPPCYWQALVFFPNASGYRVPNAGVWFARRPLLPYLKAVWDCEQYVDHVWWEQAALLDVMGFDVTGITAALKRRTRLFRHTFRLPGEWNVCPHFDQPARARIRHAANCVDRASLMRSWVKESLCQPTTSRASF